MTDGKIFLPDDIASMVLIILFGTAAQKSDVPDETLSSRFKQAYLAFWNKLQKDFCLTFLHKKVLRALQLEEKAEKRVTNQMRSE